MLVLQHNRFRNSPSITNNNFVFCSIIKASSKNFVEAKHQKKHCAHPWHIYMNIKIRLMNFLICMKSTQFLSLSFRNYF